MSADLSDPNIIAKYQEITSFTSPINWLLLSYGQSRDKLSLFASGEEGVEELRPHLQGDVFFALIREDRSFILISFVPEDISGVRRARALVHSRAVGSLFKAHHAAWTITKADVLTEEAIRSKLKLDGIVSSASTPTVQSNFQTSGGTGSRRGRASEPAYTNANGHLERAESPVSIRPPVSPPASTPNSPAPQRRKTNDSQFSDKRSVRPPMPSPAIPVIQRPLSPPTSLNGTPVRSMTPDSTNINPKSHFAAPQPSPRQNSTHLVPTAAEVISEPPRTAAQLQADASRAQWAKEMEEERRHLHRQRSRLEMQREAEAEQQALYDAERAARLKAEREQRMRAEMDEDDRRRLAEQESARQKAAARAAEEQRRRDEVNQQKAQEAQRRREEVAARIKREKEDQLEKERSNLERMRLEEEKLNSKRNVTQPFTSLRSTGAITLTGNVTTQADNSLYWRRRYFELSSQGLAFYKSSDTLANRLDLLPLEDRVRTISESHEELQAIAHSFAIEFKDGSIHLFFCDTAEDKELLTAAILQTAKL